MLDSPTVAGVELVPVELLEVVAGVVPFVLAPVVPVELLEVLAALTAEICAAVAAVEFT